MTRRIKSFAGILLISVGVFSPVCSRAQLVQSMLAKEAVVDVVQKARSEFASDAYVSGIIFYQLKIQSVETSLDPATGKATGWIYTCYSPSRDSLLVYFAFKVFNTRTIIPSPVGASVPGLGGRIVAELKEPYVDSDIALQAAVNGGGGSFLRQHSDGRVSETFAYYNPIPTRVIPKGAVWIVRFKATGDSLACIINGITGQAIRCGLPTSLSLERVPRGLRLDRNYPNPVISGQTTRLSWSIPVEGAGGQAVLEVRDVLGRRVTTIYSGPAEPGIHQAEWTPKQASPGVYLLVLRSPFWKLTRKCLVQR